MNKDELLNTMRQALREACLALEPIARRVFNDNGDHTIDTAPFDPDVYSACYYAARTVKEALSAFTKDTLPCCEICDTEDLCRGGQCPCSLSGEFMASAPASIANKLLAQAHGES